MPCHPAREPHGVMALAHGVMTLAHGVMTLAHGAGDETRSRLPFDPLRGPVAHRVPERTSRSL